MKYVIYTGYGWWDSVEADSQEEAEVQAKKKYPDHSTILEIVPGEKSTKTFDRKNNVWVVREEMKEPELKEYVLSDDYPVYGDYLYVADGKVIRSDWHGITVGVFKKKLRAKEIRNCDIIGRQERAEKKAKEKTQ